MTGNPYYIPNVRELYDHIDKNFKMYYDGAGTDRLKNDWGYTTNSPYSNIKGDLKKLISRSRNSSDNNGLSENIDNTFENNVVGENGIRPEPVVKDNGELLEDVNKILTEGWKRYNDQWDRTAHSEYYEVQKLMLRTIINSGSVVRNVVPGQKKSYLPFANQTIEPDRLDWTVDTIPKRQNDVKPAKQTQFGIELDKYGVPLRFNVSGIKKPIDAKYMDIRFRRKRNEQYIGVPWKAPVLNSLWDIKNLVQDKTVSSRINAMIAMWVHKNDAGMFLKNKDSSNRLSWEPGRIMYSQNEPKVIQSKDNLTETFDPLIRLVQRLIGIGTGLSYQILTKDLQGMNFASSRANILEDRKLFRSIQRWFIKEVCQKDWNFFIYQMFLTGKMAPLTFSDYLSDPWKYQDVFWQPPGWDWVDPLKDAKAAIELNKANMLSLKEHYANKGKNYKAELKQIAIEREYMKQLEADHGILMTPELKENMPGFQQISDLDEITDGSYA